MQLALLVSVVPAYLYVMWRTPADPPPPRRGLAVVTLVLLRFPGQWAPLLVFVSLSLAVVLPRDPAVRAIALTAAATTTLSLWQGLPTSTALLHGMQTLIAGLGMLGFLHILGLNLQLLAAREELARMAVAEERLRFARDLHDLLGHSLSVIALKSELAGGLLPADPARAAVEDPPAELPEPAEEVLGWAVREATTNVVRHSGAISCRVHFAEDGDRVAVEIADNGVESASGRRPADSDRQVRRSGSGLAGLAERVAAVGGRLQAGPRPDGGFRLRVELPLKVPAP